jgi:hypothetical protein
MTNRPRAQLLEVARHSSYRNQHRLNADQHHRRQIDIAFPKRLRSPHVWGRLAKGNDFSMRWGRERSWG